ncbi:MAG: porin, partial [Acidiphilium sp.]
MEDYMRKFLLASVAMLGMVAGATGAAHAQAAKPPAPGTLVVHLNGLLNDQINDIGSTANNVGGYKLNPIGMSGFLRLYPGFDAQTEGGLQYGVAVELRTAYTAAGQGIDENGSAGTATEGLVIRRAYGYAGTKDAGFVRVGQTDGIWWLLATGEYFNYGDGNAWDSDGGVGSAVPSVTAPSGLFTSAGALYTTNKIVYISPDIAGFQAGIDFEPNSNGFKEGEVCAVAGPGCATLAAAPGGISNSRRKNTATLGVEYTGEFDAIGVKLNADYLKSSPIGTSGP